MEEEWARKNSQFLEFVREKSKEERIPGAQAICRDFVNTTGGNRTMAALEKQISRNGPKIQRLNWKLEDKVRVLFALGVPIDVYFLEMLQQTATVALDQKNRIIEYESNDGTMVLKKSQYKISLNLSKGPENQYEYQEDYPSYQQLESSSTNHLNQNNLASGNDLNRKRTHDDYREVEAVGSAEESNYHYDQLKMPKIESVENNQSSSNRASTTSMNFENSEDSIQAITFLKQLQSLVGTFNSPLLSDFQKEIERKIAEPQLANLTVPANAVTMALESILHFAVRSATGSTEDFPSMKEFLLVFRATTFHLADFSGAIDNIKNDPGFSEKRIPYEKLLIALRYAMGFVLP